MLQKLKPSNLLINLLLLSNNLRLHSCIMDERFQATVFHVEQGFILVLVGKVAQDASVDDLEAMFLIVVGFVHVLACKVIHNIQTDETFVDSRVDRDLVFFCLVAFESQGGRHNAHDMEKMQSTDLMEGWHVLILVKLCVDFVWFNFRIGLSEFIIVHDIVQDSLVDLKIESLGESDNTQDSRRTSFQSVLRK